MHVTGAGSSLDLLHKACDRRQMPQMIASDFFMQWPRAFIFVFPLARLRA
jgi:hypothetical protein